MAITRLTIEGKRFVLLPEADFEQYKARRTKPNRNGTAAPKPRKLTAQDLSDIAAAKKALADPKRYTLDEMKRQLDL